MCEHRASRRTGLLQEVCNNCHWRYHTTCVSTAPAGEPACYRKYVTTVTGGNTQHVSAPRQPSNRPVTGSMYQLSLEVTHNMCQHRASRRTGLLQEVCNNCHWRYYTACVSTVSAGEPACYRKYVTTVTGGTTQHVSAPRQPANRPVTGSM